MKEAFRQYVDEFMGAFASSSPSKERCGEALRRAVRVGREDPEFLAALTAEVLRSLPVGGAFLDVLLGFLPDEAWPGIVTSAVEKLTWDPEHEAAAQVIRQAGFQVPSSAHSHLDAIFQLDLRGQYSFEATFHEARLDDVRFLFTCATSSDPAERRLACRALCETRLFEAFEFLRAKQLASAANLLAVGFEETASGFRRLYPERPFHIAFPADYLDRLPADVTQRAQGISHFTWEPAKPGAATHRLGGLSSGDCVVCGQRVPRLLLLDPVPSGMGVTGLDRLEICACLSCLGFEREVLHYRHPRGLAVSFDHASRGAAPQTARPAKSAEQPLAECAVALVDHGPRVRFQDWTSRENLHRVGGHPVWIDEPSYPNCPDCGTRSSFLLQIDSELPTTQDLAWLWGHGGIGYVFWCDQCKVSSTFWRCT